MKPNLTRRSLLGAGFLGTGTFLSKLLPTAASAQARQVESSADSAHSSMTADHSVSEHGGSLTVGDVDNTRNGFNPREMLTDWDTGKVSKRADGRTLREYEIFAEERLIEIAPGVSYPAWTYNGRVPGPTLRVTEGDRVRVRDLRPLGERLAGPDDDELAARRGEHHGRGRPHHSTFAASTRFGFARIG